MMTNSGLNLVLIVGVVFCVGLVTSDTVFKEICLPNPCKNEGSCVNMTRGYVCQCLAPITGEHCEHGVIHRDWMWSLAFSIPLSVLILMAVVCLWISQQVKKKRDKYHDELEYEVPTVVTNPHTSDPFTTDHPASSATNKEMYASRATDKEMDEMEASRATDKEMDEASRATDKEMEASRTTDNEMEASRATDKETEQEEDQEITPL